MPLYVRYGNEPDAFTRTLTKIVEGWARLAVRMRAWTSLCMRMFLGGHMGRWRFWTRWRW